jgi:hypothetical protein
MLIIVVCTRYMQHVQHCVGRHTSHVTATVAQAGAMYTTVRQAWMHHMLATTGHTSITDRYTHKAVKTLATETQHHDPCYVLLILKCQCR